MTKNTAHLFRRLKQLLRHGEIANVTEEYVQEIRKELRYIERSCLITNTLAHVMMQTLGRIARLVKKQDPPLPESFLNGFIEIYSTLTEHNEMAKKQGERVERQRRGGH